MMKRRSLYWMLGCLLALILLVGCAPEFGGSNPIVKNGPGAVQKPVEPVKPIPPVESTPVKVYYGTHNARYLIAEVHLLKPGPQLMQQAMEALAAGPRSKDLVAVIPRATKVNSVVVRDRTAFVDFSSELVKRGFGGSATEILAVAAIVNTLTEFPDVERVQILVEGKKVSTLFGHVDVYDPMSRSPAIIKTK
jgi:spore germination protein GerM